MTPKRVAGRAGGPTVSEQWKTGTLAVNAFARMCTEQGWVFTEVPQQADFGKDGYVDIVIDGEPIGLCIAVQVKGGPSFRTRGGYRIPTTERLREFWKFSTTPVFGIVWDADAAACFWTNITEQLWTDPHLRAVTLKASNRLPETSDEFMDAAFHASVGSEVAAALGGDDEDRQINAIWDIRALGRHDHRHLVLLRRVMFGLRPRALDFSIVTLNDFSLNFDVLKTLASVELGTKVRPAYLWSVDEAVELLERVRDEGDGYFGRGSFGGAVYWLLVGDDLVSRVRGSSSIS